MKPLTANQCRQLVALLEAGAVSRGMSRPAGELTVAMTLVIGKLRDLGLAQSKSVRRLGRSWTEYWLTPAGETQARALAQGSD